MLYLHANWTDEGCTWGQAYCLSDQYYKDTFLAKSYECGVDFNDHLEMELTLEQEKDVSSYLTEGQAWDAYVESYKEFDR